MCNFKNLDLSFILQSNCLQILHIQACTRGDCPSHPPFPKTLMRPFCFLCNERYNCIINKYQYIPFQVSKLKLVVTEPRVIRAHPNTPAMIGCGCAVFSLGEGQLKIRGASINDVTFIPLSLLMFEVSVSQPF